LQPDGSWLRFNDAVVEIVSQETVLAEKPYLLFYQRIHQ
jgi:ubiquitin C-terminal hydrolase